MRKALEHTWEDVDEFVEAYERAWRSGTPPELAEFLPAREDPRFREVLLELVRVDLELRWESSQPLPIANYLGRFPEIGAQSDSVAELAFEEYRLRRQGGEPVSAAEYAAMYGISTEKWTERKPSSASASLSSTLAKLKSETPIPAPRKIATFDAAEIARNLPDFHLEYELGRGTFSRVFLARQQGLANRLVVLKVSTECISEAHKMARLQHAHIVPIYSVHEAGELFAVCMPYFGAATLADLLGKLGDTQVLPPSGRIVVETLSARSASTCVPAAQGDPLRASAEQMPADSHAPRRSNSETPKRDSTGNEADGPDATTYLKTLQGLTYVDAVLSIGSRLANGLSHAHARGIVHRDLKPANVLLANDGRPMLLDFNLSEDLQSDSQDAGRLVGGTLPYMAPEQLLAFQQRNIAHDPRSDIYALGVMLHELLSGRQPFPARNGGLDFVLNDMLEDRRQPPPALRKLNAAVSPAAEAIVSRCLQADISRRYQTAAELQKDLERHLASLPLRHIREPSLLERTRKWARRHPRLTSATGIAVLASVQIAVLALVLSVRSQQLAKLDAADALRQFQNDLRSVQLSFLNASGNVSGQPLDIALVGQNALQRLLLRDCSSMENIGNWQTTARYRNLPLEQQVQLRADAGELLFLMAAADRIRAEQAESISRREELLHQALEWNQCAVACAAERIAPLAFANQRGEILELLGQRAEARDFSALAESSTVTEPRDLCLLACAHTLAGRYQAALPLWKQATYRDARNLWAWFGLGHCFAQLEQQGEAVACYSACIALQPEFAGWYFQRGLAYLRQKSFAASIADFDETLRTLPDQPEARLNRAIANFSLGRFGDAFADLSNLIDSDASSARAYLIRAQIRERSGDVAGAASDRHLGLSLPATDVATWIARCAAQAKSDPAAALSDVDHALKLNSTSLPALESKAHLLSERLGRAEDAVEVLNIALRAYPEHAPALAARGVLLARLYRREEALRDVEHALSIDGSSAILYQASGAFALTSQTFSSDRRRAINLLTSAIRNGFGHDLIEQDPDLTPLKDDPEFQKLIQVVHALHPASEP